MEHFVHLERANHGTDRRNGGMKPRNRSNNKPVAKGERD
jgi:hypothetical protein